MWSPVSNKIKKNFIAPQWILLPAVLMLSMVATAQVDNVSLAKSFTDDPVAPGGTVTLEFTVTNNDTTNPWNLIEFTDDLNATLTGMEAIGLPASDICGTGSLLTGTSFITFTGGSLAAGTSCTFSVSVSVPAAATPGDYINTTSNLWWCGECGPSAPASDTLTVAAPPAFSKNFSPNPISLGANSTLTFTIDNTANTVAATSLDFTDNLPAGTEVASTPNASTTCTGGTVTAVAGTGVISYSGGSVSAGSACTTLVDVTGTSAGSHLNTSGDLTSSLGNSGPASDTLTVVAPAKVPALSRSVLLILGLLLVLVAFRQRRLA